jgi:hypothetical protein
LYRYQATDFFVYSYPIRNNQILFSDNERKGIIHTFKSHLSAIIELNSGKSFNDKAMVCNNFSSEINFLFLLNIYFILKVKPRKFC